MLLPRSLSPLYLTFLIPLTNAVALTKDYIFDKTPFHLADGTYNLNRYAGPSTEFIFPAFHPRKLEVLYAGETYKIRWETPVLSVSGGEYRPETVGLGLIQQGADLSKTKVSELNSGSIPNNVTFWWALGTDTFPSVYEMVLVNGGWESKDGAMVGRLGLLEVRRREKTEEKETDSGETDSMKPASYVTDLGGKEMEDTWTKMNETIKDLETELAKTKETQNSSNTAAIAGGIVGGVVWLALLGGVFFAWRRNWFRGSTLMDLDPEEPLKPELEGVDTEVPAYYSPPVPAKQHRPPMSPVELRGD